MSTIATKGSLIAKSRTGAAAKQSRRRADAPETAGAGSTSKQSRVIAMLQSSAGATIVAMAKATGWQQHSVRGFLAGVVRKRLELKLTSAKIEGIRIYRIAGGAVSKSAARQSARSR